MASDTNNERRWLGLLLGLLLGGCSGLQHWVTAPRQPAAAPVAAPPRSADEPPRFLHGPFAERRCTECHDTALSQKLKTQGAPLCLRCHTGLLGDAKFIHAPVESGDCLACHDPHEGSERYRLKRHGRALCLECHDAGDVAKVPAHAGKTESSCLSCHNPHRSNRKGLLRAP